MKFNICEHQFLEASGYEGDFTFYTISYNTYWTVYFADFDTYSTYSGLYFTYFSYYNPPYCYF